MGLMLKRPFTGERRASTRICFLLLGGIFVFGIILVFLLMCELPCSDNSYAFEYEMWKRDLNVLAPSYRSKYTLVVLIMTAPDNFHERSVIRETWLAAVDKSVVLYRFVIGMAALDDKKTRDLENEKSLHKDIVLLYNVKDGYEHLTFKLLQSFIWVERHVNYQYLLKVDDDSFVVLYRVLSELKLKPKERLYWGFFDGRANVKTSGKWKETEWILCDTYLPYARGGGYVLSYDLVRFVARNSDLLQLFLSEDVSVGTWLAPLKVHRHHDQNFDTEYMSRGCLNSYLVMHKQSATNMRELHYNLERVGQLCKTQKVLRGSYEYNWHVPPSRCCNRSSIDRNGRG